MKTPCPHCHQLGYHQPGCAYGVLEADRDAQRAERERLERWVAELQAQAAATTATHQEARETYAANLRYRDETLALVRQTYEGRIARITTPGTWAYSPYRAKLERNGVFFAMVTPDGSSALGATQTQELLGALNHVSEDMAYRNLNEPERAAKLNRLVAARLVTKLYDAANSTSIDQEIAELLWYRYANLPDAELDAEVAAAGEALAEISGTEPTGTPCEECGNVIPDEPTDGGLENRHHRESCSLYSDEA